MEKEYIEAYMLEPYYENDKGWIGSVTSYRPTNMKYYTLKIPVPDELIKEKLGEIETEKPVLNK